MIEKRSGQHSAHEAEKVRMQSLRAREAVRSAAFKADQFREDRAQLKNEMVEAMQKAKIPFSTEWIDFLEAWKYGHQGTPSALRHGKSYLLAVVKHISLYTHEMNRPPHIDEIPYITGEHNAVIHHNLRRILSDKDGKFRDFANSILPMKKQQKKSK